jgi:uncharacterized protein (TIGR02118 family)
MTQLVVLYRMPKDPKHFEKYYHEVHGPMTGKLYGIGGYKYGRVRALDGGTGEFFWYWSSAFDGTAASFGVSAPCEHFQVCLLTWGTAWPGF